MEKGTRKYSDGDIVGYISEETANEINKLGFNTAPGAVLIPQKTIDYINRKRPDVKSKELKDTIESPTEVLPNIGTKEAPYRSRSVLLVKKNGGNYISIVEIKPGEEDNILWNFWREDIKTFERYLEKFRKEKAQILESGGRRLPHIPPGQKAEGKPESLSGSQTEHLSFSTTIHKKNEKVKDFVDEEKQARKSKKGGFTL